jgi:hypothetical protein
MALSQFVRHGSQIRSMSGSAPEARKKRRGGEAFDSSPRPKNEWSTRCPLLMEPFDDSVVLVAGRPVNLRHVFANLMRLQFTHKHIMQLTSFDCANQRPQRAFALVPIAVDFGDPFANGFRMNG